MPETPKGSSTRGRAIPPSHEAGKESGEGRAKKGKYRKYATSGEDQNGTTEEKQEGDRKRAAFFLGVEAKTMGSQGSYLREIDIAD